MCENKGRTLQQSLEEREEQKDCDEQSIGNGQKLLPGSSLPPYLPPL